MLAPPKSFYEATGEEARKLLRERVTSQDHHYFKRMDASHRVVEASEYIHMIS